MGLVLAAGMLAGLALLFAAVAPAYADLFTVTAGKDVYDSDERVIIAGTLPEEGSGDVRVQITKDDRQCALHAVRPDHDRSFVSKPLNVANCGPGQYRVTAHYGGMTTTSAFVISADSSDSYSGDLRIRTITKSILMAQEAANGRVKEVVDSGVLLPELAAQAQRKGVVEASLALQALQHGSAADARIHHLAALAHFREVMAALAPERLTTVAKMEQQTMAVTSGGSEKLAMLQDLYGRLADLSEKNDVRQDFGDIAEMLSQAEEMIGRGDAKGADRLLENASVLLEQARAKLVAQAENSQAKRILASADKLEKRAEALLDNSDSSYAGEKINEALSFVKDARSDVAKGDYASAREHLSQATKALNEAKKAIGK
ncbi:MAG: hypothetical protein ACREAY_04215 [Nitrososphaera sp.]|uniref:hypothetical protein n=1 Tax=Nitrososphaera sp. TaxID=1971748 RepID=UPI003D6E226A